MKNTTRGLIGFAAAAMLLGTTTAIGPANAAPATSPPVLVALGDARPAEDSLKATDSHTAETNAAALVPDAAAQVTVELPDGTVTLDLQPGESGVAGWDAWDGSIAGQPASTVTMISDGSTVNGIIASADGTYNISTTAAGDQVVQAIDTSRFIEAPNDALDPADYDLGPSGAAGDAPFDADAPAADTSMAPDAAADVPTYPVIDVLVGYTPGALSQAGSLTAMKNEINVAISSANTAYANSGIAGRVRLVGTVAVANNWGITESGLDQLSDMTDGTSDSIHRTRNDTGADVVSVFTADSQGAYCGLGWLLGGTVATQYESFGFTLVNRACASGNFSFAHELGHNMGMGHDRYLGDGPGIFSYSYGYVNVAARWRTIMSYNNACSPNVCTRLGYFSNPNKTYNGAPMGRPSSAADSADGARTLNITQPVVAKFRSQKAPFTTWARFVSQQAADFKKPLSAAQANSNASALDNGQRYPESYIAELMQGPTYGHKYGPVSRLYQAYFLRIPDKAGLDQWGEWYRTGSWSLASISQAFANSPEFKNRYGTLNNGQFVDLLYQNILGRAPDAAGRASWVKQLDQHTTTRGAVMIGFSESTEYRNRMKNNTLTVLVYRSMLGRVPTASEMTTMTNRLGAGTTLERIVLEILDMPAYAARVTK